jgi:hypothetical protein
MYSHLKLVYEVLNQTMPYRIALNQTMESQILSLVSNDRARARARTHTHTHHDDDNDKQICIHDVSNANC